MIPNPPQNYGLAAIGRVERFTVEILETSAGSHVLSIESDTWSFSFALNEHTPAEILAHLRGSGATGELRVGIFLGAPVLLIRDEEFSDRFFLRFFRDGDVLDFVLAADLLAQFTDAMAQAVHDLAS